MVKTIIIFISAFICLNVNAQKGKLYSSSWHSDGASQPDVSAAEYTFFKKGSMYYFISNNNDNIFVDLLIEDQGEEMRILKNGLTIWVSMESKPDKKMGIRYPAGPGKSKGRYSAGTPEKSLSDDASLNSYLSQANTIELIGFISEEEKRFSAANTDNFRGSVKLDGKGPLHYELIMPMAKLPLRNSRDSRGAMPFTLGIEYGPASQPELPPVLLWIRNIKLASNK